MLMSKVKKNNYWLVRNSRYNTKHEQACVGGKAIKWSMITQSSRARMVFLIMNSIDILEILRMLMMITTQLSRDFMKV